MIQTQSLEILPTFGALTANRCDEKFGFSERIEVAPDVMLSPYGIAPTTVYWIEAGVVKKIGRHRNGSECLTGLRTRGWIVGAAAALVPSPREPMAITATNCTLRSMPVETFVKTYQESRMFSKYVTNLLAIELALRLRVDGNSRQPPLRAKVMQFIEDCDVVSRSMPEGISPLKLKSAEIAQMVGSTPEHLSELLCQMEQEGLLGGAGSLLN